MSVDIHELDSIAPAMARTVAAWLPAIDLARYVAFLDMMVHYTRRSGERLRHAAEVARTPALREFFAALADDEQDHWRLAAADLAALGAAPSAATPPEVADFHAFWTANDGDGELAFLGALEVLEDVGRYLQVEVRQALGRLGLTKHQARFVLVHLEVDLDHGARARALRERFAGTNPAALLHGARAAASFWVAIHRAALAPT